MSKVPAYQLPARLIRSVYGSPATFGGINVNDTCAKMQRAVEILAEIRALRKSGEYPNTSWACAQMIILNHEADKLLTELEVQPSAEGREG